jgi:hypothetical protein
MTSLKYCWTLNSYGLGGTTGKTKKPAYELDIGIDNPYIAKEFQRLKNELAEESPAKADDWYGIAWLLATRSDELIDEVSEELANASVEEIEDEIVGVEEKWGEQLDHQLHPKYIYDQ